MCESCTDEELVNHYLVTRRNDYFEQLYQRYCDKVYQRCLSYTNDKMQADDLTQDIFLRLLNKLDTFKQQAKFSTWLYSITRNYCTDQIRDPKQRRLVALNSNWDFTDLDTEDVRQQELVLSELQAALRQLSPVEQHLLQKKYQDDVSIQELANLFSLTESAVKMRLKRSRDRLRHQYKLISETQANA